MKGEAPAVIDKDAFAKAGDALKKLNVGEQVDLTPCGKVATVLKTVRTEDGFNRLDASEKARLRTAAAKLNPRFDKNDNMLLNFLSEAFGATNKPTTAESARRDRVGTFLLKVAEVA